MAKFIIHLGYSRNTGRIKNRYFDSLEAAREFAHNHFKRTGIVVAIEKSERRVAKSVRYEAFRFTD